MGTADFYVIIELSNGDIGFIDDIFKSNKLFKDYIGYHLDIEENTMHISCAMGCFFPITTIIYDLYKLINVQNPIIKVESRKDYRPFDFLDEIEFFCWLYNIWKKSLDYFYETWGGFLIHPSDYYGKNTRSYIKLKKKYFIKYSKNRKHKS